MLRQFGNMKILAGLLAVFALVLAACTPPEGGEGVVHTLTVEVNGDGTVVSDPPGINTSDTATADFAENTDVTLTATAGQDSTFTAWGGACDGTVGNTCVVSMDQAQTVTATFTADEPGGPFTLSVNVIGDGSVTSDPVGIDCPGDCDEQFEEGTEVTLTANPGADAFVGWGGACTGADTTCVVTVDATTDVTATFATEGEGITETFDIEASSDDAEEFLDDPTGTFPQNSTQTNSSDLDMTYDTGFASETLVGLRFANVTIPAGATVQSATLTFTEDDNVNGAGTVTFTIFGQAADNPATFEGGSTGPLNNISGRDRTAASVQWESTTDWTGTADSENVASVVQEIIDREGWSEGNALVFIIESDGDNANYRVAESFDEGGAPQLTVTYLPPAPPAE